MVSRFPDSPDPPSKTAPFNSLRPRAGPDYFSLEDIVVFWCYGAYTSQKRSDMISSADHRRFAHAAISDHCPTPAGTDGTVRSGPRTPVNDLKGKKIKRTENRTQHKRSRNSDCGDYMNMIRLKIRES